MEELQKQISKVQKGLSKALQSCLSLDNLETIRVTFLGRKGSIAGLMPFLKAASSEEKREFGPKLNQLKSESEQLFFKKQQELSHTELRKEEEKDKYFDVTSYKPNQQSGNLHPYTHVREQLENIFISLGYHIASGPEVETDANNFKALNIPDDHPARDSHDTFWMNIPNILLRTHTSTVQIQELKKGKLPLAAIAPGRAFRHEATDASHDCMFEQIEAIVVDENISISNLLATLQTYLKMLFGESIKLRARPGYFPFVEPGIEVDASCPFCKNGCSTCGHTGWIEMGGAGLIHPNVLKHAGVNPEQYSGFAFGFGLTRMVMLKYGIQDIRLLHNPDNEFLKQF